MCQNVNLLVLCRAGGRGGGLTLEVPCIETYCVKLGAARRNAKETQGVTPRTSRCDARKSTCDDVDNPAREVVVKRCAITKGVSAFFHEPN